jgi:protein-disulfide isomerase
MPVIDAPPGHTPDGGVLVGSDGARRRLVVFEDLQCPYCREFEEASSDLLRREVAAGAVAVEYRIRSFLGEESVRAANALAVAAGSGQFDQLRQELFAHQPPEHSGGYTAEELVVSAQAAGITDAAALDAIRDGRYDDWVRASDDAFQEQDPRGTPFALLDGQPLDLGILADPDRLGELIRA